jgi:hypothetical protein
MNDEDDNDNDDERMNDKYKNDKRIIRIIMTMTMLHTIFIKNYSFAMIYIFTSVNSEFAFINMMIM